MNWRLRPGVSATAALVVGLGSVASAAATIVPDQGVAEIRLQMTKSQVLADLGKPAEITESRGALGSVVTRLHYRRLEVDLERLHGTPVVIRILTTRTSELTTSGVGVGSGLTDVKRIRGAHCWWEATAHYCGIGSRGTPMSRLTLFWIGPQQRVTLISVSLVVNS